MALDSGFSVANRLSHDRVDQLSEPQSDFGRIEWTVRKGEDLRPWISEYERSVIRGKPVDQGADISIDLIKPTLLGFLERLCEIVVEATFQRGLVDPLAGDVGLQRQLHRMAYQVKSWKQMLQVLCTKHLSILTSEGADVQHQCRGGICFGILKKSRSQVLRNSL